MAPAGYSNLTTQNAADTNGATTATAEKPTVTTTTEDPGTFTSAIEQWVSWTIGVVPIRTGPPLGRWDTARAAATTTAAKWLAVGDSVTEGYGSTNSTQPWRAKALATIRTRNSVSGGGRGYIPSWYSGAYDGTTTWPDIGITTNTGDNTQQWGGLGWHITYMAATQVVTWTVTGTHAHIWHSTWSGGGAFTWAVDGGSTT